MLRAGLLIVALWMVAAPALAQGPGADPGARPPRAKAPWGALTDIVGAVEIVLGRVCLPGIVDRKPIADLAYAQWLVVMPPKSAGAQPADKVWRLASLTPVYAVAWTDGSCSTFVDRGPSDKLREMAERTIRARPEGFVLDQTGPVADGSIERSVYCGGTAEARYVATIATPRADAPRQVRALASTVYRAGPTGLCSRPGASAAAGATVAQAQAQGPAQDKAGPQLVRPTGVGGCIFRALPESVNMAAIDAIMSKGSMRAVLRDPVAAVAPRCTGRPYSDSDVALVGSIMSLYQRIVAAYALGRQLQLPQRDLDAAWSAATPAEKAPFLASAQSFVTPNRAFAAASPEAVKPLQARLALGAPGLDPKIPPLLFMYYTGTALSEVSEAELAARGAPASAGR